MLDFTSYIREISDFPKPGILYKDITPLLLQPQIVDLCVSAMIDNIPKGQKIHKVVGVESRGFILSSILAQRLNTGLVLVRKEGKLPYHTFKESYSLEYGKDCLEIHTDSIVEGDRVLIHDDVLASGGTANATTKLVKSCGGHIVQLNFLVELTALKGRKHLQGQDIFSLIQY